jgi:magnesium transporter
MITVWKSTDNGLHKTDHAEDGCWIDLINPSQAEISDLLAAYNIPDEFIQYPMDMDESSRTEVHNGAILIGLRFPIFVGDDAPIPYTTMPLGIVITDRIILTVSKDNPHFFSELTAGRERLSTVKRNRFVLRMLLAIANKYLYYLREINRKVDTLENKLQRSLRNKEVLELLKYQKCLTLFMTALKSNELVIGRLQKTQLFLKYEEDRDLLEDVLTEVGQAIEMTSISSNILSQMMDAFASIISNNLNSVMKFLASITIVLSLPTLVASIYGMNIGLPLQGMENAFVLVMGITLIVTVLVVMIFMRKDWL